MGKKSGKQNGGEQQQQKEEDKNKGGENITVVLRADLHCEGCAHKVMKSIRSFDGVDAVTIGDDQKITVVGLVDPAKLREKVEKKTHKRVELISPAPKKDGGGKEKKEGKENAGGGNGKQVGKKNLEAKEKPANEKSDEKKPKEKQIPVITAVFKVNLHCDGCIRKIHKTVAKSKGYEDIKIDKQKDLVTVTGAIDMKALGELLQKQLKKDVKIVPTKEVEKKSGAGGGGGGNKGADNNGGDRTNDKEKIDGNKMQAPMVGYPSYPFMYGSAIGDQFHYNTYAVHPYHAPQIFSDENPNACSVM